MENSEKWTFSSKDLANTPSIKKHVSRNDERSFRQNTAIYIEEMGRELGLKQLTMNTAVVYMHRFLMLNPITEHRRSVLAAACLFLAAKVEDEARSARDITVTCHTLIEKNYNASPHQLPSQDLIIRTESMLLRSLGFDIQVNHSHPKIVEAQKLGISKDIIKTAYMVAHFLLQASTMCLAHKTSTMACICLSLAAKLMGRKIIVDNKMEDKPWYKHIDPSVGEHFLDGATKDLYYNKINHWPMILKNRIMKLKVRSIMHRRAHFVTLKLSKQAYCAMQETRQCACFNCIYLLLPRLPNLFAIQMGWAALATNKKYSLPVIHTTSVDEAVPCSFCYTLCSCCQFGKFKYQCSWCLWHCVLAYNFLMWVTSLKNEGISSMGESIK